MKILLILVSLALTFSSNAQTGYFNYTTGAPLGDYSNYVSEYSWRGIEAGFNIDVTDNLSLGMGYRYLRFYEKHPRNTVDFGNGAITSVMYAYSFVNNINFVANYKFDTGGKLEPYITVGLGPSYVRNLLVAGIIELEDDSWRFSLTPGAGITYNITDYVGLNLKVDYNWIPTEDFERIKNISYLGTSIGLSFDME